jgi:hypothetical protein
MPLFVYVMLFCVTEAIKEVCDILRKAYARGYLADLLHESPEEGGTWVLKPFTLYRDYFLQDVLYTAEYELRAGFQTYVSKKLPWNNNFP